MPRLATKLASTNKGGFIARKVIPFDVRDEYAKLYGQRTEERLNTGPLPISLARAKHREWSSEIEARIANIRAARKGEGRTLTPKEARALAGEWYHWFTARMAIPNWPGRRMGGLSGTCALRALRSSDGRWRVLRRPARVLGT